MSGRNSAHCQSLADDHRTMHDWLDARLPLRGRTEYGDVVESCKVRLPHLSYLTITRMLAPLIRYAGPYDIATRRNGKWTVGRRPDDVRRRQLDTLGAAPQQERAAQ